MIPLHHFRGFNPTLIRSAPSSDLSRAASVYRFQSHLGSISTQTLRRACSRHSHRFNPTLVRLARVLPRECGRALPQFQSHLGSISTGDNAPTSSHKLRFQSHLGSISTPMPPPSSPSPARWFQSHLGSISTPHASPTEDQDPCFNPTLVRLAPQVGMCGVINGTKFQSHLGSISTSR